MVAETAAVSGASEPSLPPVTREGRTGSAVRPPRNPYQPMITAFPIVGYTPDTSVAFAAIGLLQYRPRISPPNSKLSTVSAAASYTLRRQFLVVTEPSFYLGDGGLLVDGSLSFARWESDFFGIGSDSRFEDSEEFLPRSVRFRVGIHRRLSTPKLYAGFQLLYANLAIRRIEGGGLLHLGDVEGSDGGVSVGLGTRVTWDDRDRPFFPARGTFAEVRLDRYSRAIGSQRDYTIFNVDGRGFVRLSERSEHILAGQAVLQLATGRVPFYDMASLGGMKLMRGMSERRFRDRNMLATQLEYRSPFVGPIGFVTFGGLGTVFNRFQHLDPVPKWSTGVGVRARIQRETGVNIRLDYAISQEQFNGVYFSVTEAF